MLALNKLVVILINRHSPALLVNLLACSNEVQGQAVRITEQSCVLFAQCDHYGSCQSGQFDQIFHFIFLLSPVHAIGKYESTLCISVTDLNCDAFSRFYDVKWAIRIRTDEILNEAHRNCHIFFQLKLGNTLNCTQDRSSTMHIHMHLFNASCRFQVESSGIEAHSLPNERCPLLRFRVAIVSQVNENRLLLTCSTHCMHQPETLFNQLISLKHGHFQILSFRQLLGFLQEELWVSFVCSGICPLSCSQISLNQFHHILLIIEITAFNFDLVRTLLLAAKHIATSQKRRSQPSKILLLLDLRRELNTRILFNFLLLDRLF